MTDVQPITPFDWFANQFTTDSRVDFIQQVSPYLEPIVKPGDHVLDLCCGAGPITLYFEELGAGQVLGLDLAPYLIVLAREEAARRNSQVEFLQADALTHPLGKGIYDLISCFGNPILDFPHDDFPRFRDRVFEALKPGGHFILEYRDGLMRVQHMRDTGEMVEDGVDSQISRRFMGYDPGLGAFKMEYKHLSRGETYNYIGYVYTGPLIQIIFKERFKLGNSIQLGKMNFMDIYIKPK